MISRGSDTTKILIPAPPHAPTLPSPTPEFGGADVRWRISAEWDGAFGRGPIAIPCVSAAADATMSVTPRGRDAIRGMAADEPMRRVGRQGPHPFRSQSRPFAALLPVFCKPSGGNAARIRAHLPPLPVLTGRGEGRSAARPHCALRMPHAKNPRLRQHAPPKRLAANARSAVRCASACLARPRPAICQPNQRAAALIRGAPHRFREDA
jgi:hypothetical protein